MKLNLKNKAKERKLSTATPFGGVSDQELLLQFHSRNWAQLSPLRRLWVMQEIENRRAKADGRPALKVFINPQFPPEILGGHTVLPNGMECICLNPAFIQDSDKLRLFSGAKALNVILHEGRHAFQYHSVKDGFKYVSEAQRIDWMSVMGSLGGKYTSEGLMYWVQSIEMDARRFARRKMAEVQGMFRSMGIEDPAFNMALYRELTLEKMIIARVRQDMTVEMVDRYETMVLEHLKKTRPELDLTNLRPFDHLRFILMHPEITDPLEMLERLDRMADEKLGIRAEVKIDQIGGSRLGGLPGMGRNGPRG